MKNLNISMLCLALPFAVGCSTVNATTPAKSWGGSMNKKELKVESFSQLDSASKEVRPPWLTTTPERIDGYYFIGMSSKRTEKRDARNESFNDALIGFARFCGLNVQYLAEHRDKSLGGNGGLIDTWTEGSTIAKMQANMHLGNVTTEDRYTEKYSSFYGGRFMGHTYVDASLVFVPIEEMELCREHTQTANTFIKEKATEVNTLTAKNDSLESENKLLKKQNNNLTNVAMSQANNSAEFFKQAGYSNKKQPVKKVVTKRKVVKSKKEIVANNIGKNVGKIVSKKKTFVPKKTVVSNYIKPKATRWNKPEQSKIAKTNTTVEDLTNFKGCVITMFGGLEPGTPCSNDTNRYEGEVARFPAYNSAGNYTRHYYYAHGNGILYSAERDKKIMEGIFRQGNFISGSYYDSQTGKLFNPKQNVSFTSNRNVVTHNTNTYVSGQRRGTQTLNN